MGDKLRFHPQVADDLSAATQWYDDIFIELGNRFRRALNSRLDFVERQPEVFGRIHEELRAARLVGFPYFILFEHSTHTTEVVGIFTRPPTPRNGVRACDKN